MDQTVTPAIGVVADARIAAKRVWKTPTVVVAILSESEKLYSEGDYGGGGGGGAPAPAPAPQGPS